MFLRPSPAPTNKIKDFKYDASLTLRPYVPLSLEATEQPERSRSGWPRAARHLEQYFGLTTLDPAQWLCHRATPGPGAKGELPTKMAAPS